LAQQVAGGVGLAFDGETVACYFAVQALYAVLFFRVAEAAKGVDMALAGRVLLDGAQVAIGGVMALDF